MNPHPSADAPAHRPESGHLPALDGLRGLAILLVLAYHFTLSMSGQGLPARLLFKLTSAGWSGVDLFFVLSGFLITGILSDARDSPNRFRNFYARRSLRIFPLYYGTLAAVLLALPMIESRVGGFGGVSDASPWLWSYGTNLLVAGRESWFPLSHFWSLAVEEHFYLFWPAVIFGCGRKVAFRVCGAMILIAAAVRIVLVARGAVLAAYCLTACRMDALAIGSALALAARGPGGISALVPRAKLAATLSGAALLGLAARGSGLAFHDPRVQVVGYPLLACFFAAILALVVARPTGSIATAARFAPLRSLGRYSYGLYVYNSLFLLVAEGTSLLHNLIARSGSTALGRCLYVATAASTTLAVAWLSYHLFEKHFLKLKRHFPASGPIRSDPATGSGARAPRRGQSPPRPVDGPSLGFRPG